MNPLNKISHSSVTNQFTDGSAHRSIGSRKNSVSRFVVASISSTQVFAIIMFLVAVTLLPSQLPAQLRIKVIGGGFVQNIEEFQELNEPQSVDPESGAVLKTDPDLEASLQTAERFKDDGNYRIATQLWQAVLGRSGDALYSKDQLTYFSLVQQVEGILADLPPEGLEAYRVFADAEAKEILAEANDPLDTAALNNVVRLYFISSLGDDAAFALGCIYLDRFDFIGARRMFEKIDKHYPDSSVPREDILVRIALCQSYLGQTEAATRSLDAAAEIAGDSSLVSQVRSSLGELNNQNSANVVDANWSMPLRNARRYGVMPGVPDEMMQTDLVAVWQYYFEPDDAYNVGDSQGALLVGEGSAGLNDNGTVTVPEEKLIEGWKEKNWRPAGHLLFDDGRVYFKSAADLSVWNTSKISEMVQSGVEEPEVNNAISWRTVWRNSFEIDEATQMIQTIRRSWGGYGNRNGGATVSEVPQSIPEVQLFGDGIYQQMSICNGVVYSIEGKSFDDRNRSRAQRVAPQWNTSFRRTRTNFLTAYDAVSGVVRWTLPRVSSETKEGAAVPAGEITDTPFLEGGGFMAAPIEFGDLVLVPVNNGGSISVYALNPENGSTVWKSFLCDEPETGAEPWSAITLTLDGSDLFVNSGMGVVFVLDPATGMVRFAKRYERVGTADDFRRRSGWTVNRLNFSGWSNDVIIPYGRQMICFSSDTESISAFDRDNGDLIWKSEMSPIGHKVDYLLGIYNDVLYAGGRDTIIAYDLKGEGRMVWGAEQMFDGKQSKGRGVLTPKGLYMPVEDSIYHFSLSSEDGGAELLSRVQVRLGTKAPVGNLYSDGKQFWIHGANRLYVLAPESE